MRGEHLYKLAFIAPFTSRDKEHSSGNQWMAETGNRLLGRVVGGFGGAMAGGTLGLIGGQRGSQLGAVLGGAGGMIAGDVVSLKKTEKKHGIKPTTAGQYAGRVTGSLIGNSFLPGVGGFIGDYVVSRNMQHHRKAKNKQH